MHKWSLYQASINVDARKHFQIFVCLLVSVLLAACSYSQVVPVRQVKGKNLIDGGDKDTLIQAAQRSLTYYEKLLPSTSLSDNQEKQSLSFVFGKHSYSTQEMIDSTKLFLSLLKESSSPQSFSQLLKKDFLLFEVSNAKNEFLFTGYFEPEIPASSTPQEELNTPLYARPKDLIDIDFSKYENIKFSAVRLYGKLSNGQLIPYDSRMQIQQEQSLNGRSRVIAWVSEVDLFFLQIQGSGILRLPDGKRIKVGYAASNSHPYRSIGALLVEREQILLEDVTMQSLRLWIKEHPQQGRELMFANPSYVFFEVRQKGPIGSINLELTPQRSLALDDILLPKGALAFVSTSLPSANLSQVPAQQEPFEHFMLVQDTGGAIRGYGRGDIFFGSGAEAEWNAGQMREKGRIFLLVAKKSSLPASVPTVPSL